MRRTKTARATAMVLILVLAAGCDLLGKDEPEIATARVTYSAPGAEGSVPVDGNVYREGDTVIVLDNTGSLTMPDELFIGWNTMSDGTGSGYVAGDTFQIGKTDVILHAMWAPYYRAIYIANEAESGEVPVDDTRYLEGQSVTVRPNTGLLAKYGATFIGWNTMADGYGTAYAEGATVAMENQNLILYAAWTTNPTYTISYAPNGADSGEVPIDTNNYQSGQTATVLANTGALVMAGHSFAGWNTQEDGQGTDYQPGSEYTLGSMAVTLFARWTPVYSVSYNGNNNTSGTVPVDSVSYPSGASATVLGNTGILARTNHIFAGWNTQEDGLGTDYLPGDTYTIGSQDVVLHAEWIPVFAVAYHANGAFTGTVPVDSLGYQSGATVTVKTNSGSLTKNGYTFDGWNTTPDYSGTKRNAGSLFTIGNADVNLHASWDCAVWGLSTVSGSLGSSGISDVEADGLGNVYAVGWQYGTGTVYYGNSVSATGLSSTYNAVLIKYNSVGLAQWAKTLAGSSGQSRFNAVAVDSSNDVYVVGSQYGSGTFQYGPAVTATGSAADFNAVIAKFSGTGGAYWAKTVSTGTSSCSFVSIAVDGSYLYAAGNQGGGTFQYDTGVTATGLANTNALLVKYNNFGSAIWARTSSGTDIGLSGFESVCVDIEGNPYAAGYQYGTQSITYGTGVSATGPNSMSNALIVKYNVTGTAQWARSVVSGGSSSGFRALTYNGYNIWAGGYQNGTGSFTYGPLQSAAGVAVKNGVLVRYATDGAVVTIKVADVASSTGSTEFYALAADASHNVYAAGYQVGTGTNSWGSLSYTTGTASAANGIVLKAASTGGITWARTTIAGSNASRFQALGYDAANGALLAGGYQSYNATFNTYSSGVRVIGGYASEDNALLVKYEP